VRQREMRHAHRGRGAMRARNMKAMRENFSLIVMCVFLILSLAFLAQQFAAYR
jgi:hypothetical protein